MFYLLQVKRAKTDSISGGVTIDVPLLEAEGYAGALLSGGAPVLVCTALATSSVIPSCHSAWSFCWRPLLGLLVRVLQRYTSMILNSVPQRWDSSSRPEAANLLGLYGMATGMDCIEVARDCDGLAWGEFKQRLADALVEALRGPTARCAELRRNPQYLEQVLREGAGRAEVEAESTLRAAKAAMGFYVP
eukprot:SAG11_NODE_1662_length_4497_cov_2.281492_4_plen_190_part_00